MINDPLTRQTSATEIVEILGGSNYGYNNYLSHEIKRASERVLDYIARNHVFRDNPGCAQFMHLIPRLKAEELRRVRDQGGDMEAYLRYLDHKGKPSVSEEDSRKMLELVFR